MSKRSECKRRFLTNLMNRSQSSSPQSSQEVNRNFLLQTKPFKSQFYNPRFHTFPHKQAQILSTTLSQILSKSNDPKFPNYHEQIFEDLITNLKKRRSRDNRIEKLLGNYSKNELLDDMLYLLGSKKEYVNQFWVLIQVMESKGLGITKRVYFNSAENFDKEGMRDDLIKLRKMYVKRTEIENVCSKICMLIRENEWNDGLRKKLMVLCSKDLCNEELVRMVIEDLGLERTKTFKDFDVEDVWDVKFHNELKSYWDPKVASLAIENTGVHAKKALLFFRLVEEKSNLKHSEGSYNAVLRVLSLGDCVDEFWRVVGEMKGVGYEMDVKTYDFVTKAFYKRGMFKHAVDLYEWRVGCSTNPSVVKDQSFESTAEKFEGTNAHLINADLPFDSLLPHFCLKYKAEDAYKLLIGMIDRIGLIPLEGTYRMLIRALLRHGKLDEIMNLFWLMRTTHGYAPAMINPFRKFLEAGKRREAKILLSYCPKYFFCNQALRILFCTEEPASFWEKNSHFQNDQILLYKRREALRASRGASLDHRF